MKYIILLLLPLISFSQSDVPDKYWLDDGNFEKIIGDDSAFGDDNENTIVVEFWAEFNKDNCFNEWEKIENANYYRINIANAPVAKKKYKVRMAPTILIFKEGVLEESFKAGLDLLLPTDLNEIQETINEINNASKF
tara:strand:+ start:684 stop:1094 length:411 start_codon:yes stop_codon:yes gene_type:complete